MIVMRSATLGCALALGAAGAHAQTVISHRIDNAPVETTITQTPGGTVVTRRPLAAPPYGTVQLQPAPATAPAATTEGEETVGVAPTTRRTLRTTRHVVHHVVHHARRSTTEHTVTRTVTRRVAAAPLVIAPAQRQVIYRTLVQQQVIPQVVPQVVPQAVPSVPGYPAFPPPAARTVVVAPSATTGYGVAPPDEVVDDDVYAEPVPAAPAYRTVYTVGSVLPASVAVTPLPAAATVAVPAAQPYSYATVDGRVLLVDPATDTVVADITP